VKVATALAHPNIALVKYWGKRDVGLNLPAVSSLSLTLDGFHTTTTVAWGAPADEVVLGGEPATGRPAEKVLRFLDLLAPGRPPCRVVSANSFPTGAGLASSASAFAALAVAGAAAAGLDLDDTALSRLARQGSGSACRSLWGGFVTWRRGERPDGADSHGVPLLAPEDWDVAMVVAVVSTDKKAVGSTEGMERARTTSPLYATWVAQAEGDVAAAEAAVAARDLPALGRIMEASTYKMHATMTTSDPPLLYWQPGSVACLHAVWALREQDGVGAWTTMDAGPQVKVLCRSADAGAVARVLRPHAKAVHVLAPGGPARVLEVTEASA
jgi:diphosphomevalonate decarboxylase